MPDTIQIKVRGYHLDLYGHVNNTRYLEFLEEARWTIKEKYFNFPQSHDDGRGFVVVNTNISYHHPACLGDTLKIRTSVKTIGSKSATFLHEIYKDDILITHADVTFVIIDLKTGKAVRIEGEWRRQLEALQEV